MAKNKIAQKRLKKKSSSMMIRFEEGRKKFIAKFTEGVVCKMSDMGNFVNV